MDGNGYKRHKDAIAKFNEVYVANGIFPREFGRIIHRAEDLRHSSDYDDFPNLDEKPEWKITADSEEQTYFDLEYVYCQYERKGEK